MTDNNRVVFGRIDGSKRIVGIRGISILSRSVSIETDATTGSHSNITHQSNSVPGVIRVITIGPVSIAESMSDSGPTFRAVSVLQIDVTIGIHRNVTNLVAIIIS